MRYPTRLPYLLGLVAAFSSALCAALFVYAVYLPATVDTHHHSERTGRVVSSYSETLPSISKTPSLCGSGSERSSPIPEHEIADPPLARVLASHSFLPPTEEGTAPRHAMGVDTGTSLSMTAIDHDKESSLLTVDMGFTTTSSASHHHHHHHHQSRKQRASPLKTKLLMPAVERMVGKQSPILIHVSTDFLLASWVLLLVSMAWALGSFYLLMLKKEEANARLDYVYATSLTDSTFFCIGCVYYISGGYYVSSHDGMDDEEGEDDDEMGLHNPLHIT